MAVDEARKAGTTPSLKVGSAIEIPLKYISLGILVLQTSSMVLILRYSRTLHTEGAMYISSTAVAMVETVKIVTCVLVLIYQKSFHVNVVFQNIKEEVWDKPVETLKLAVPAGLYTVQNNLLYVALSNLDAATYQVTYQLKILTTAIFSVAMLKRKLDPLKWFSLVLLMVGVALVQWPSDEKVKEADSKQGKNEFIGVVAVLAACITSGFSGVYFEKILKGSNTSLWMRNIQLALFGVAFALAGAYMNDLEAIRLGGFFQGYDTLTWIVITNQAFGGLVVATVVKYADNILKGFATSLSIIVSSVYSFYILKDFIPTSLFFFGTTAVLLSTYLYSKPAPPSTAHQTKLKTSLV